MSKQNNPIDPNRPSEKSIEKGYKPDPNVSEFGNRPNPKPNSQSSIKLPTPPPSSKVKNDKGK